MLILPAIDLRDGRCVRLEQGDYDRETRFSDDPLAVARGFVDAGAPALHVVDLDGAREGRPVQAGLVGRLCRASPVPVQVGGGLRTAGDVEGCLAGGAERVLLGTAAVRRPGWLGEMVARWGPGRIAAAVDAREGRVAVEGWTETGEMTVAALLDRLEGEGVETVVYTDTRRDGTLGGPDVEGTARVAARGLRVVAAGGIRSADHVAALRRAGAAGAVLGSALYRGTLTLEEALDAARGSAC
ncbi:MAG TPA: 1-(5-phosphoribosyl)-5-[(5-phosphoribosylamino)methylideneamino]imidazole-4-carboxamide isomerase [Gemmatimonadota bacterium]|nr:1-(5-phosphoribosyl)-5-[(5-phosphoribosylamino)methylideneamino]imidazole-4-carboxamide isomerase [Gemmatimonadota bacterium]